jgi:RimJ/RimL family protein N-acetyltransferase
MMDDVAHLPPTPLAGDGVRRVRDMRADEAHRIVSYFHALTPADLARMGIDPAKMPDEATWNASIQEDLARPMLERRWHFVIWEIDGAPVGHSNIGDVVRGEHGTMHLHVWRPDLRARGHGRALVVESARRYFEVFDLRTLYCQPNAFNVAPNRTLARAGFEYLETVETIPGWLNFHHPVTRWALTRARLDAIRATGAEV